MIMTDKINNLKVWSHADKIDPAYTKKDDNNNYSSLSLNSYWIFKKATELFGPIGIGWGFDIIEEREDIGHTVWIQETLKTNNPIAEGVVKNHTTCIALWYKLDGKEGRISGVYGHTNYIYKTAKGRWITDGEAPKKSLTDAMKKALSLLGFAGEVFMGEYDNPYYLEAMRTEHAVANEEEKTAIIDKKQDDLKSSIQSVISSIQAAFTPNEANGFRKAALRDLLLKQKLPELSQIASRGISAIEKEYTAKIESLKETENGDS